MNYENAKKIIENNKHLIGKYRNYSRIDEIMAVPTKNEVFDSFVNGYIQDYDAERSILPFINFDLKVIVLFDKIKFVNENMFIYEDINRLINEFEVIL